MLGTGEAGLTISLMPGVSYAGPLAFGHSRRGDLRGLWQVTDPSQKLITGTTILSPHRSACARWTIESVSSRVSWQKDRSNGHKCCPARSGCTYKEGL
jgi:hypothetical protein